MFKSKHPAAQACLKRKIFEDLQTFSQLEERISSLSTNKLKGDVFEVFVEGFLTTQPAYPIADIWPWTAVPAEVKQGLELPRDIDDFGIDGVFRTIRGQIATYQVKFRSDRGKINWGSDKIGNFFGLTKRDDYKYIITNSHQLPFHVIKNRKDVCSITAEQFEKLTNEDFSAIDSWLKGSKLVREKKTPRSHQTAAINDVVRELKTSNRATAVMACGSGKSLVGLWVAEITESHNTLVLLPSLALLSQIFHEWMTQTNISSVDVLCVCSDQSVTNNTELKVSFSDQDFPVSTESDDIKNFLKNDSENKVLFSTYQSAPVVASAMPGTFKFDLAIFDEAHKTSGREGKKFAFALKDENIAINKRLFLTATPKYLNVRKSAKDEHILSYSMNNEEVYGRICHRLSFADAVSQGIICPYKVVITVLTKQEVDRSLLNYASVNVFDELVKAKQVANQLALKKIIEKHKVNKIITFHATVKSAMSFCSPNEEGIETHIPEISSYHVNGKLQASHRNEIISKFKKSDVAVLSNARCLTEGVDVPEVDMVAFLSPKRSKIDVIQAAGRAMRKDRLGIKEIGYVLVPIYLNEDSDKRLSNAMYESDFAEVFEVLNALQQQDEVLAESLCEIREKRDEIKGFVDERYEERVSIEGPELILEDLKKAITTKIVNKLTPIWYERFSELKAYYSDHNHSDVPANWKPNKPLANWVRTQRALRSIDQLSKEQIKKLETLEFTWNINETRWDARFLEYFEFVEEFGTYSIPNDDEYASIRSWVITQRKDHRNGSLDQSRFNLLDDIGFIWDIVEERWNERYLDLLAFFEENGSSNVPRSKEFQGLYSWTQQQRKDYKARVLSDERIDLLNQVKFDWITKDFSKEDPWEIKYNHLKAYFAVHGTSYVPARYPIIGQWSAFQRGDRRKGKLSTEKIKKLDDINFVWEPRDKNWLTKFFKYKNLVNKGKKEEGTTKRDTNNLRAWGAAERRETENYRDSNDALLNNRAKLLSELNPIRTSSKFSGDDVFIAMLERLAIYKEANGHSRVPTKGGDDIELGRWVDSVRKKFKNGKLEDYQIDLLEDCDFDFNPSKGKTYSDQVFSKRFKELESYKSEHGHLDVPFDYGLGAWLSRVKTIQRKGDLEVYKHEALSKLGVNFKCASTDIYKYETYNNRVKDSSLLLETAKSKDTFKQRLEELKNFKNTHGHINIPTRKGLGAWLSRQKTAYRKGQLTQNKISDLVALGVDFSKLGRLKPKKLTIRKNMSPVATMEQQWQSRFLELIKFKDKMGHTNVTFSMAKYKALAGWVKTQRANYRNGSLTTEHKQQLASIAFEFVAPKRSNSMNWEERYKYLLEYYKKHGHVAIPKDDQKYASTRTWLKNQINFYRQGRLNSEREKQLRSCGVDFEKQKNMPSWTSRYEELIQFKSENGHVDVPQLYGGSTGLGRWVNRQRQFYRLGTLLPERKEKLDKVGFIWGGNRGRLNRL